MPRGRKKKNPIDEKIAQIGDYVSPKVEGEEVPPKEEVKEEVPPTEVPPTEIPPKEKLAELTPEEIKEKIVKLVSDIGSRGLTEEEKIKFIENFKFWNSALFELLDIGNNLKTIAGRTSFTLTPGQALLAYLGGTAVLLVLLRPDLQQKIFKTKPKPEAKPPEKPIEEAPTKIVKETSPGIMEGGIPKKAPKPKFENL